MKKGFVFSCIPATRGNGTPMTPEDRLRLAKDAGFQGVEISTMDDLGGVRAPRQPGPEHRDRDP
jgi:sugar phosphate isomerase/epimerase